MIKIGCISIDVSHPKTFANIMAENKLDMKYEYVCKSSFRSEENVDWFVNKFGLKGKVENVADMVDNVDVAFIHACNWDKHLDLALPFIEKGKPVFIDKPIIGSVDDIKRIRKLVEGGAKIFGGSAARSGQEIKDFLNLPIEERGEIISVHGTCGVDEFNYGIHIVEILSEIVKSKIKNCKFNGVSNVKDTKPVEAYSVEFENGVLGTYHIAKDVYHQFDISLLTTTGTHYFRIDVNKAYDNFIKELYSEFTKGESSLIDVETLINCTEAMLCGKKSKEERKGEVVSLNELTGNESFDGYAFEEFYSKTAADIYKD